MIELVRADQEIIAHKVDGKAEIADAYSVKRLEQDYRDLEHIVYRGLSITSGRCWNSRGQRRVRDWGEDIQCDNNKLHEALRFRVFGEKFIARIAVAKENLNDRRRRLTISGSDGSMHAGTLAIKTARGFYEEVSDVITFNNSIVYVRLSDVQTDQEGREDMVHQRAFHTTNHR